MREQIQQHITKHEGRTTAEIAAELDLEVIEVDEDLNALRDQGKAVEIYNTESGYVWSAAE